MRKLQNIGNALVGLFVPEVTAGACGTTCSWYSSCWQCSGQSCIQKTNTCNHSSAVYCGATC